MGRQGSLGIDGTKEQNSSILNFDISKGILKKAAFMYKRKVGVMRYETRGAHLPTS